MSITTTTELHLDRSEACTLVIKGLESIRDGILIYHQLGLGVSDLYEDLKAAGWTKSKRTLQRAATDLRTEGLLPQAEPRGIHAVCAKSGAKPVENTTTTQPKNDSVNADQLAAALEAIKTRDEYIQALEQALESHLNDTRQVPTPLPEYDSPISASPDPEKYGTARLEMGDEAVDDFNRVHRLLDEISAIEGKYFCKGIWGPAEWKSIYGAHVATSASSNAQRNYKHRPKQDSVIEVRGTVVEDEA